MESDSPGKDFTYSNNWMSWGVSCWCLCDVCSGNGSGGGLVGVSWSEKMFFRPLKLKLCMFQVNNISKHYVNEFIISKHYI